MYSDPLICIFFLRIIIATFVEMMSQFRRMTRIKWYPRRLWLLNEFRTTRFFDLFFGLNHWNQFLNYSVNYFIFNLNMVLNFLSVNVLHNRDYLFNYSLDFNDLRNLNDLFNDLFYENRNLNYLFNDLFNGDNFLGYYINRLKLCLNMIDDSLNLNRLLDLNYPIFENLNFHQFRHFLLQFNYLLHDGWNFYNRFNLLFIGD